MDERFNLYKLNAELITTLRERQEQLSEEYVRLHAEHSNLYPAFNYMNLLIDTIKKNPGLEEEWEHFLEIAGMPEQPWKEEYAVDRLPVG